MNMLGYVGDVFSGTVHTGFRRVEKIPRFDKSLETQNPLPTGCAF